MKSSSLISAYFRQLEELSLPDPVLTNNSILEIYKRFDRSEKKSIEAPPKPAPVHSHSVNKAAPDNSKLQVPRQTSTSTDPLSRLSKLKPLRNLKESTDILSPTEVPQPQSPKNTIASGERRNALREYYYTVQNCEACPLGKTRTKMVFGSGNAEAPLMVIGEAPGADEDSQGLPFVGRAGKLLTDMLAAIKLDRKNDVFIANVLKCRPPDNRNPDTAEIIACKKILLKQIDIIQPRVLLLLGRIAAHALLDSSDSITILRSRTQLFESIPAFVTYHPAALLRNPEYKKPAWEDLQKLQAFMKENALYDNRE